MTVRNALILALLIRYAAKKFSPRFTFNTISDSHFVTSGAAPSLVFKGKP